MNRRGYRVIEADGSATALVLWAGQASTVDLLLTDLNLPGNLSGARLADRFRQARPGLKVVYATDNPAQNATNRPRRMTSSASPSRTTRKAFSRRSKAF